jgi:hypothetical protein
MKRTFAILFAVVMWLVGGDPEAVAATEYVTVVKVLGGDDKGIIQRRNWEKWLIEKGVGALSFWRYDGKQVLIHSPGIFCGVGSKIILPDDNQEARIWNAEILSDNTESTTPTTPVAQSVPQPETVKSIALALVILKYFDPKSEDEEKRDALRALRRFQTETKLSGETNRVGPQTLAKLAELVLKERGDNAEGLQLAQTLIASACQMKNLPSSRVLSGSRTEVLTETFITSIAGDGAIVKLADGSICEIDALDHITTMLWLPTQNVLKKPDGLINLDNGESVSAKLLK